MGLWRKLITYGTLFFLAYNMGRCSAINQYKSEQEIQPTPTSYSESAPAYSENLPDISKIDWNDFLKYDASKETIDKVIEGL